MTLHEFGELIIWMGAVAAAVVAIGGLLHFAIVRPLRKWIKEQVAKPLQETAGSLQTSNGKTAGEYIENSSNKLDEIEKKMEAMAIQLQVTNQLAIQTHSQALANTERIDRHLRQDHGAANDPTERQS